MKSNAVKKLLQGLFVFGSFYFIGQSFYQNRTEILEILSTLDWVVFTWALLLLLLSFLPRPVAIYFFLRGSLQEIGFLQSGRAYFLSQLAKYLPGGIWVFPSRIVLLKEFGVPATSASLGLVYESIAMVLSSACIAIPALGMIPADQTIKPMIFVSAGFAAFLGIIFVLFAPETVEKLLPKTYPKIAFLNSMAEIPIRRRFTNLTFTSVIYIFMWISTGISFYLLILALGGGAGLMVYIPVGVFSLAWLVGFLSVFNPGGIGLREAAILLFLGHLVSEPILILVALLSRVSWSLVEVFYFGVFSFFVKPGNRVI